jgi:hypothetical protein
MNQREERNKTDNMADPLRHFLRAYVPTNSFE